jgi:hypothetical protein
VDRRTAEKVFPIFFPLTSWNDFHPSLLHNLVSVSPAKAHARVTLHSVSKLLEMF